MFPIINIGPLADFNWCIRFYFNRRKTIFTILNQAKWFVYYRLYVSNLNHTNRQVGICLSVSDNFYQEPHFFTIYKSRSIWFHFRFASIFIGCNDFYAKKKYKNSQFYGCYCFPFFSFFDFFLFGSISSRKFIWKTIRPSMGN